MIKLNIPQKQFIDSKGKFNAFVGGYRSGKTLVGSYRLIKNGLLNPGIPQGYFAPTYPQISDIFYETIDDVAEMVGVACDIKLSTKEVTIYTRRGIYTKIKCRSMEHPGRIVGFDIAHALVDEIDCMNRKKADAAWKKIIARMSTVWATRQSNTVDVTTTPEGYGFVYDQFVKKPRENEAIKNLYTLTKASTRQNRKNLPDDYIDSLYASYPSNLVDAYIDGEFVNLTTGAVYPEFCRKQNHTDMTIKQADEIRGERSALFIGMDFNVNKMAACVFVRMGGRPYGVGEIIGARDTPDMINRIKARYPDRRIVVCPDASGKNRKSVNANETDISLLRQAGFGVDAGESNPYVKDRINSVNAMILNAKGERRLLINTDLMPETTESLEQQVYKDSGEPDKSNDKDHAPDALGYFIYQYWPINTKMSYIERM